MSSFTKNDPARHAVRLTRILSIGPISAHIDEELPSLATRCSRNQLACRPSRNIGISAKTPSALYSPRDIATNT